MYRRCGQRLPRSDIPPFPSPQKIRDLHLARDRVCHRVLSWCCTTINECCAILRITMYRKVKERRRLRVWIKKGELPLLKSLLVPPIPHTVRFLYVKPCILHSFWLPSDSMTWLFSSFSSFCSLPSTTHSLLLEFDLIFLLTQTKHPYKQMVVDWPELRNHSPADGSIVNPAYFLNQSAQRSSHKQDSANDL